LSLYYILLPPPPRPTLFPYTTLFRSDPFFDRHRVGPGAGDAVDELDDRLLRRAVVPRRKNALGLVRHDERLRVAAVLGHHPDRRSEEHTSELQSRSDLVCRLLLEKKK